MVTLRLECVKVRRRGSNWKQSHLLNDIRSFDLDVKAINETRISMKYALVTIFKDYGIFLSSALLGTEDSVAVSFQRSLGIKARADFLEAVSRLDVNGSEGDAFRLVAIYGLTGAGMPDFFRHRKAFLATSLY